MKFLPHEVQSISPLGLPMKRRAVTYVCDKCESVSFHVVRVAGDDHEHIECCNCNTYYCFGGKCKEPINPENG